MIPPPVTNTYDLTSIVYREPFYVRRNAGAEQMAAMMVSAGVMLVINPNGEMETVASSLSGRQRSWQFIRYFTEDETLTIAGSMPGEGREALPEVDVSDLPTQDKVRENKSTAIIPDGVYFHIRGSGGTDYWCVNCPPGKSQNPKDRRQLTVMAKDNRGSGYIQDTEDNLTGNPGWEFLGYALPEEVPERFRAYPKK